LILRTATGHADGAARRRRIEKFSWRYRSPLRTFWRTPFAVLRTPMNANEFVNLLYA